MPQAMPDRTQPPASPTWQAREVVRDLDRRPHLLVCLEIQGPHFPQRAMEPAASIGEPGAFDSLFAEVSDDGRTLRAYFPVDLPRDGPVVFGYTGQVLGTVPAPFDAAKVKRVDRARLEKGTVVVARRSDFFRPARPEGRGPDPGEPAARKRRGDPLGPA